MIKILSHLPFVLTLLLMRNLASQAAYDRDTALEDVQIEFYVLTQNPKLSYIVKSFQAQERNSVELANRFHGLTARGLEAGVYAYVLMPGDLSAFPEFESEQLE